VSGLDRALAGLAAAGIAIGAAAAVTVATSDSLQTGVGFALITLFVGFSFIGAGLIAWRQRPDNRFGALMAAAGFTWFLAAFETSQIPALFVVGASVDTIFVVLTVQLLLSYPTGRLTSTRDRIVVGIGWLLGGVLIVVAVPFFDYNAEPWCTNCPENPLLISEHNAVVNTVLDVVSWIGAAVLLVVVGILVNRWAQARGPQRRAMAPVIWAGAVTFIASAVLLSIGASADKRDFEEWLASACSLIFATVPFAFLIGLTKTRAYRAGAVSELLGRLEHVPGPEELRDALARALGDRTLELAYWLPEGERFVDASGQHFELPGPESGRTWRFVPRSSTPWPGRPRWRWRTSAWMPLYARASKS
jgi:hypothetical protein